MSVQMTVRIPDDLAAFVDDQVAHGATSRAEVIARALRRERRRQRGAEDALIYASTATDADLDQWIAAQQSDAVLDRLD